MKIFALAQNNVIPKNFKGEWQDRVVGYSVANKYHTECTYVSNEGETLDDIACAWRSRTGYLPSEWAREHNIYNKTGPKNISLGW